MSLLPPERPCRISVVSDHVMLRDALSLAIDADARFTVCTGSLLRITSAAARMAREHPDLLILHDCELDGDEANPHVRKLRESPPFPRVVVLAANATSRNAQATIAAGAHAYVASTSSLRVLFHALQQTIDGQTFIDPAVPTHTRSPQNQRLLDSLSRRERDVLGLIGFGHTNTEIAVHLGLSVRTVETHRSNISDKLRVRTRAALVSSAIEAGLLDPRIRRVPAG